MSTLIARPRRSAGLLAVALGLTAALAVGACSSSGSGSGRHASNDGSSAATATARSQLAKLSRSVSGAPDLGQPVDTSELAGKTIFYVPIALKAAHFPLVQHSLEEAAGKVGAHLYTCDGQGAPTGFGACLDQAAQRKPAAVITDYIPYNLASTGYEKLRAAGIPVFIAGALPAAGVATSAKFAFGDPENYGFNASEGEDDAVIADSDGKAHILYLLEDASAAIEAQGQHGIDYFKTQCPDCSVTVKKANLGSISNIPSLVSGALVSDPSIDYVIPQTDTYLAAAVAGIQAAGKTSSIKISSSGDALASVQQVKSNPQLLAMAGSNPPYLAWTMADSVFRMMAGEVPPKRYPVLNRVFTKENVGSLDLTPAGAQDGTWFGSTAYKQAFAKLWGAK